MKVLITGTHSGIGYATAQYFLNKGFEVVGLDIKPATVEDVLYTHYTVDVRDKDKYPDVGPFDVIVANAGVQNSGDDIGVNLKGVINTVEFYIKDNTKLKSIVIIGSSSALTGAEFPEYAASKGGLISYTKNVANRVAPQATCNCLCPGGVLTELNNPVMSDKDLWNQIMDLTPLKRWATPVEIAEWVYFLSVTNRFMTSQALLIDGGEADKFNFIWPDK